MACIMELLFELVELRYATAVAAIQDKFAEKQAKHDLLKLREFEL